MVDIVAVIVDHMAPAPKTPVFDAGAGTAAERKGFVNKWAVFSVIMVTVVDFAVVDGPTLVIGDGIQYTCRVSTLQDGDLLVREGGMAAGLDAVALCPFLGLEEPKISQLAQQRVAVHGAKDDLVNGAGGVSIACGEGSENIGHKTLDQTIKPVHGGFFHTGIASVDDLPAVGTIVKMIHRVTSASVISIEEESGSSMT